MNRRAKKDRTEIIFAGVVPPLVAGRKEKTPTRELDPFSCFGLVNMQTDD